MFRSAWNWIIGSPRPSRLPVLFAILLAAILSGVVAPEVHAQTEDPSWIDSNGNPGRILVSRDGVNEVSTPITVEFNGAESFSYWIKLSAPPNRDGEPDTEGWWIRIFVEGANRIDGLYKGIRWVPSVGREFDQNDWNTWRQITFRIDEDYDEEANGPRATSLNITHEVWATNQWCPLHNAAPINVNVEGDGGQNPTIDVDNPPSFSSDTATRSISENIGDATETSARNAGATVRATGSGIAYSLAGTDAASFDIDSGTGQIKTNVGSNYDHEAQSSYSVTVRATNSAGNDTIAVTVNVTDRNEPPLKPDMPDVQPDSNDATVLSVSWTAPTNTGRPDITGYNLQYREGTSGNWRNGPRNVSGLTETLMNLRGNRLHQVRVQAINDEGTSPWSDPDSARTDNNAPEFSNASEDRSFQENIGDATSGATNVGARIQATDPDNDTLEYSLEGTDADSFTIDSRTGQLRTKSGMNYSHEDKETYSVTVRASDNTDSDTVPVTITVTDRDEPPLRPAAPVVSTESTTSVSVAWSPPDNTGRPPITGYNLQYREGTSGSWTDGPQNTGGLTTTLTGLRTGRLYQVQVQAINDEGTGPWSPSGSGRTNEAANSVPQINDPGPLSIEENTGSTTRPAQNVDSPVTATDADNDPLTFTLEGAEARFFAIGGTSGQIMTRSGTVYDREDKASYTVTVKVSDGKASDTVDVIISVTDVSEPPNAPAAPRVRLAPEGQTGLSVSWTAPSNRGRPPITGYNLQCQDRPGDTWRDAPSPDPATDTNTILGFNPCDPNGTYNEDAVYEVRVQAINADGVSKWSPPGRLSRWNEGDTVQKSWIIRFARTVGSQVLDAVTGRMNGGSGTHVSLAGVPAGGAAQPGAPGFDTPGFDAGPGGATAGWRGALQGRSQRGLQPGSSFQLSAGGERGDPTWTAWGRFGYARFDAKKKPLPLFGNVTTAVVGADIAQDRWLGGIAVSVSEGAGVFELAGDDVAGKSKGRLTNIYGYGRYRVTETIDVWGLFGYGGGKLKFKMDDEDSLTTDIGMRMVSAGVRGELPARDWNLGIALALKADAMWVQAESDAVGDLAAARGEATRMRLLLEGSRAFDIGDGSLTLTGEAGLRHDEGDADTGVGILVGGGVRYNSRGYTFRGHAHGVLAHAEKGFGEWGITGEFRLHPGRLGRGFFLTVAPGWGAAPGGVERMQSAPGAPGTESAQAFEAEGRLNADVGYGLRAPVGAGLLTPHAGLSLSMRGTRQWRAGARWRVAPEATVGIEGTRDEARDRKRPGHSVMFRAKARW